MLCDDTYLDHEDVYLYTNPSQQSSSSDRTPRGTVVLVHHTLASIPARSIVVSECSEFSLGSNTLCHRLDAWILPRCRYAILALLPFPFYIRMLESQLRSERTLLRIVIDAPLVVPTKDATREARGSTVSSVSIRHCPIEEE
jgi:hypothetical protein